MIKRFLVALVALALVAAPATAQFQGEINAGAFIGNPSAAKTKPTGATASAMFDRAFCSTPYAGLIRTLSGGWLCFIQREALTGARDYYVRVNGNDGNCSGLVNADDPGTGTTPRACALKTAQKVGDVIWNSIDTRGFAVTAHFQTPGTYSGGVVLQGAVVGGGTISFVGDTVTPANVLIDGTSGNNYGFNLSNYAALTISGFKIQSLFGNVVVTTSSSLIMSNYEVGIGQDFQIESGGRVESNGNFTISGNKSVHVHSTRGGRAYFRNGVGTLVGTPAFSGFFAGGSENSILVYEAFTFSGAATGQKYFFHFGMNVRINTVIACTKAAIDGFFPGSVTGVLNGTGSVENCQGAIQSADATEATTGAAGAITTAGGIYAAKDLIWGGQAPTAFSPTFSSTGGFLGSNYSINSASFKEFGKKTEGRVRATFTNINTGSGRLIMTVPTTTTTLMSGSGTIRQEVSGKSGVGSLAVDVNSTISFTLADGTFPAAAGGEVLDIWFTYFKD